jgi:hypothetical protein
MRISWNLDGKAVVVIAIAARLRKRDTGTATIHANQVQLLQVESDTSTSWSCMDSSTCLKREDLEFRRLKSLYAIRWTRFLFG